MYTNEIWVDVMGFEGHYIISNMGRIMSIKNGKNYMMNPNLMTIGYYRVSLSAGTIETRVDAKIHRLVAEHFVPNPDPINYNIVNHKNGITTDNRASNLEWCDIMYNNKHRRIVNMDMNRGENNPACKFTNEQILEVYNLFHNSNLTKAEISSMYNMNIRYVYAIGNGETRNDVTKHKLVKIMSVAKFDKLDK